MTALGVVLMDKSGRRPLLLVGTKKSESSGLIVIGMSYIQVLKFDNSYRYPQQEHA